jgi:hypothetical protein
MRRSRRSKMKAFAEPSGVERPPTTIYINTTIQWLLM